MSVTGEGSWRVVNGSDHVTQVLDQNSENQPGCTRVQDGLPTNDTSNGTVNADKGKSTSEN